MSDPSALAFNCAESVHPVATHYAPRRARVGVRQAFGHLADLPSALPPVNLRLMLRGVPRHRVILIALLSLLLLFLQQESVRHQLDHLGAQLERAKHSALERPTGDACLECELLAGGTSLLSPSLPATFADSPHWIAIVVPPAHATISAPSFYRSRAPPSLLQPV